MWEALSDKSRHRLLQGNGQCPCRTRLLQGKPVHVFQHLCPAYVEKNTGNFREAEEATAYKAFVEVSN